MDSGELDFYQHDKVCSNTCRSTKIDLSGARVSLSSPTSAEYIPLTPATADGTHWRRGSVLFFLFFMFDFGERTSRGGAETEGERTPGRLCAVHAA